MEQSLQYYQDLLVTAQAPDDVIAFLGRYDRFFLLTHLCNRVDAIHPWLYDRCREVEKQTDDCLDLWARDHYKSTIVTYMGIIQEIINDPDITVGIFSHSRPIAKAFMLQIMRELEFNETLKRVYSDALWADPRKESPVWSQDNGIVVRRKTNPKESTVEAWGLVDGQPISKHFRLLVFDDVVTMASVNTPDQIRKTTEAWELAQNLGSSANPRSWHVGTRYSFADTYGQLLERGALKERLYPATHDGTPDGEPVFLSKKVWEKKKRESSAHTIACQQLLNPLAGSQQEFDPEWMRPYEVRPKTLNVYILVDYAGSRTSGSSRTAFACIGVDRHFNKYLLDGAAHKMSLDDRWILLKRMRNKWINQPGIQSISVGYERYGAQSDIQHFEAMMRIEGNAFPIQEVNWPRQGEVDKDNRIRRLIPDHKNWRFFYPYTGDETSKQRDVRERDQKYLIAKIIKQKDEEGQIYDVVEYLRDNEFRFFPATTNKDLMDAMSRIYDMEIEPPMIYDESQLYPEVEE